MFRVNIVIIEVFNSLVVTHRFCDSLILPLYVCKLVRVHIYKYIICIWFVLKIPCDELRRRFFAKTLLHQMILMTNLYLYLIFKREIFCSFFFCFRPFSVCRFCTVVQLPPRICLSASPLPVSAQNFSLFFGLDFFSSGLIYLYLSI
jgi:hypothetical protein